jgi:hypothetical protein
MYVSPLIGDTDDAAYFVAATVAAVYLTPLLGLLYPLSLLDHFQRDINDIRPVVSHVLLPPLLLLLQCT